MNILIIKPSSLGDVIHAVPVLRCLRRHLPDSHVYWWIESALAPLLEDDPDLTGILLFERKLWASPRHWPDAWRTVCAQRQRHFDWVIDLQSLARTGLLAWLANGNLTVGLDDPREGAPAFYDLIVQRPSPQTHAVDWYLSTLPLLGVPVRWDYDWLPPRPALAARLRERWSAGGQRWIVLLPGARWPNKRWPARHFVELVRRCALAQPDCRFAILGAHTDGELGQAIAAVDPARCVDLTGRNSLPEMVEWIRLSDVMVSNDTGPMHVAAALGKPVLGLFGPTNPHRTGPYGPAHRIVQHRLACVPCMKDRCSHMPYLECLEAISPARVAEQLLHRLRHGRWQDRVD